ncbi:helix-turn-helix domain-containing protein [Microtetraspora malaysiensis]|uniref:helix-turn-helix domain-containing protein n=1 Tax=Microtetraspora malaysiensis TaxID=161358 RepID=UPI000ACF461F|nr:helix-turn-helix transcriptional regulator [Microtetraspora malaysiensis]
MTGLAELMLELKERSGMSYGALAKRLHVSTSTLHRYCSGEATPAEFAVVERFGKVCRATPEEQADLHRRWLVVDALRQQAAQRHEPHPHPPEAPPREAAATPRPRLRPRPGWILAATTAALLLASAVLAADLRQEAPSAHVSAAETTPLAVTVNPYAWPDPCTPRYLVNRPPSQVQAPPAGQEAPTWVAAHGAVTSGDQLIEIAVQGTGAEAVVLHSIRVRVAASDPALPWNDYLMGFRDVGCGGPLTPRGFEVDLDAARPIATPGGKQRGFPLKVDVSDPEVLMVTARSTMRDVRWFLELEWSSGARRGLLRIDDAGAPFHVSGARGRPSYDYSLDAHKWMNRTDR